MTHSPRFHIGPKQPLPVDLDELGRLITLLPEPQRSRLMAFYDRVVDSFRLRSRIMNVAKESLARLRLEMVFLQFDLDITQREREELRKQIKDDYKDD